MFADMTKICNRAWRHVGQVAKLCCEPFIHVPFLMIWKMELIMIGHAVTTPLWWTLKKGNSRTLSCFAYMTRKWLTWWVSRWYRRCVHMHSHLLSRWSTVLYIITKKEKLSVETLCILLNIKLKLATRPNQWDQLPMRVLLACSEHLLLLW